MRISKWPICISWTAAVLLGLSATLAPATTTTWTGTAGDSDWFNSGNWDSGKPGNGDTAIISSGSVLLTNVTANLAAFTITNATFTFTNWYTVLNATTVTIRNQGTLTLPPAFTDSQMSNRVAISCTDLTLDNGGTINATGKGYAVGYGPGAGYPLSAWQDGSGGGNGGRGGVYFYYGNRRGSAYGDIAAPVVPGSGGGGWPPLNSGSCGGGAVRIQATDTVTINGSINADGTSCTDGYGGGGAGGVIYISCGTFGGSGTGVLSANGGNNTGKCAGGGGGGRIAVTYSIVSGTPTVRFATSPGYGMTANYPVDWYRLAAEMGTVCLPDTALLSPTLNGYQFSNVCLYVTGTTSWAVDSLTVSNCSLAFASPGFHVTVTNDLRIDAGGGLGIGAYGDSTGSNYTLECRGSLRLTNGGSLYVYGGWTNAAQTTGAWVNVSGDIVMGPGSWIYPFSQETNGGAPLFSMSNLAIATNAGFDASAKGWKCNLNSPYNGFGPGGGTNCASTWTGYGSGGGYGGQGGGVPACPVPNGGGPAYGALNAPVFAGSASGGQIGGTGGGLVRIDASGSVSVNGTIAANGALGYTYAGGGSGGGIFISCHSLSGGANAVLSAAGGNAVPGNSSGGGGGGRIAVWFSDQMSAEIRSMFLAGWNPPGVLASNTYSGFLGSISATNGVAGNANATSGQMGTVAFVSYVPQATRTWTGVNSADWFDPQNWYPAQVPGNGESVIIGNYSGSVLLSNSTANLSSFTITNATLTFTNWSTVLNATSVAIQNAGTVTLPPPFTDSQMSNRVAISCTDFTLDNGGTINATGKGYALGYGPGKGIPLTGSYEDGSGGGCGGRGGLIAYGTTYVGGGYYGAVEAPVVPGSGGGGSPSYNSGSNGGGAVRIQATGTVTINGCINADGTVATDSYGGGGAGGVICISCGTFGGSASGILSANGANATSYGGGGAGGRIAVMYSSVGATHSVRFATAAGSGGMVASHPVDGYRFAAEMGTVCLPDTALLSPALNGNIFSNVCLVITGATSWAVSSLTVSNCSLTFIGSGFHLTVTNDLVIDANGKLGLGAYGDSTGSNYMLQCGSSLRLTNGGSLYVYGGWTNAAQGTGAWVTVSGDIVMGPGSWIYPFSQETNGGSPLFSLSNLAIATNAGFDASAKGWKCNLNYPYNGFGPGGGTNCGSSWGGYGSGGGYGGQGGGVPACPVPNGGGPAYGLSNAPVFAGSASGGQVGGTGGGLVRIEASGNVSLNGTVAANAGLGIQYAGGGSGGGILISCRRLTSGANAVLSAAGANGLQSSGGGGGGRIAVWYGIGTTLPGNRSTLLGGQMSPNMSCGTAANAGYVGTISVTNGLAGNANATNGQMGTVVFIDVPPPPGTIVIMF